MKISWLVIGYLCIASPSICVASDLSNTLKEKAVKKAQNYIDDRFDSKLELYYYKSDESEDQSLALRYNFDSAREWEMDGGSTGKNFSGQESRFYAKGNFVLDEEIRNPTDMSEIGGSISKRWFVIDVANALTMEEGEYIGKCMAENEQLLVEDCRKRYNHEKTEMSYWYADIDAHVKIEGDQSYDQRHYVFGFEANLSRQLGQQQFFIHPTLTLGVESVDPKDDLSRNALLSDEDSYKRYYGEIGFTGNLFGSSLKHNFKIRHFEEIDAPVAISNAGLDTFTYWSYAIQVPAILLGLDNKRNSFIVSYTEGELPFSNSSDKVFEIGFRHDIDFKELLQGK